MTRLLFDKLTSVCKVLLEIRDRLPRASDSEKKGGIIKHYVGFVMMLVALDVAADFSNAETIAALSGRILGAAKACGVDGNRLAVTAERALDVVLTRVKSEHDRRSAILLYSSAHDSGVDEVKSRRSTCRQARAAFEDIEAKFRR